MKYRGRDSTDCRLVQERCTTRPSHRFEFLCYYYYCYYYYDDGDDFLIDYDGGGDDCYYGDYVGCYCYCDDDGDDVLVFEKRDLLKSYW